MSNIDPSLARRISDCARAVQIAKAQEEKARTFEERVLFEKVRERAEAEMNQAALLVNRGLDRAPPTAQ